MAARPLPARVDLHPSERQVDGNRRQRRRRRPRLEVADPDVHFLARGRGGDVRGMGEKFAANAVTGGVPRQVALGSGLSWR
jgi:hypothetical protein